VHDCLPSFARFAESPKVGVDVPFVLQPNRNADFICQILWRALAKNLWKISNTLQTLLNATYIGVLFNEK
jgi:hypothetical protein